MPEVSLLIPYRAGDPWRDEVWRWMESAWRKHMPRAEICTGDDPAQVPFSRSAAVNAAARKATSDVLVNLDADTWLEPRGIRKAASLIRKEGHDHEMFVPKARKFHLLEEDSRRLIRRNQPGDFGDAPTRAPHDKFHIPAPTVMSRRVFEAVNGFDERFIGWGCEDNAFMLALQTLGQRIRTQIGDAYHVWHPTRVMADDEWDKWQVWDGQTKARPGLAHLENYFRAYGNGVRMRELVEGNRTHRPGKIPRKLHRVWVGGKPIPEQFESWWQLTAKLNPDWELRTWRDNDIAQLRLTNRRQYVGSTTLAGKADVARYEILQQHGGVYLDVDFEPVRPLPELEGAWACEESPGWVANGAMGSEPWHPAINAVVSALPDTWKRNRGGPVHRSGPGLLTATWKGRADVTILCTETFYPYHYSQPRPRGDTWPSETVAVHHWAASWQ